MIVNYSITQFLYHKSEKEEPVLKTEEISEKPSAFIQEVAGRKPQDSDKVPTPMKPGLKMKNVNNSSYPQSRQNQFIIP